MPIIKTSCFFHRCPQFGSQSYQYGNFGHSKAIQLKIVFGPGYEIPTFFLWPIHKGFPGLMANPQGVSGFNGQSTRGTTLHTMVSCTRHHVSCFGRHFGRNRLQACRLVGVSQKMRVFERQYAHVIRCIYVDLKMFLVFTPFSLPKVGFLKIIEQK